MKIKLTKTQKVELSSPKAVCDIIKDILLAEEKLDKGKEHLWVIGVNSKNTIVYIELVHLGALDYCIIDPTQIFRTAIYYNSASIIIAHNHPSGNPFPSQHDTELTKQIKKGGEYLSIPLLDHVIIGNNTNKYYSFQKRGIL